MAGRGRPTSYSEEMQNRADEYVSGGHEECGDVVPSIAGLACELNVDRTTMYAWAEAHEDFSHTLSVLKHRQERMLLSGGLSGTHNAAIAKLMLANHGYSDKQSQEISGPSGGPIETKTEWVIQPVKPVNETNSDG